jgi:hypothetical protein
MRARAKAESETIWPDPGAGLDAGHDRIRSLGAQIRSGRGRALCLRPVRGQARTASGPSSADAEKDVVATRSISAASSCWPARRKGRRRLRARPGACAGVAEIAPRAPILGAQAHGGFQLGHRLLEPVQLEGDESQVEANGRVLGRDLRGLPVDLARLGQTPQLEAHQRQQLEYAQIMRRIRLRAQQFQLRLGQALRDHQLAGAMKLLPQGLVSHVRRQVRRSPARTRSLREGRCQQAQVIAAPLARPPPTLTARPRGGDTPCIAATRRSRRYAWFHRGAVPHISRRRQARHGTRRVP